MQSTLLPGPYHPHHLSRICNTLAPPSKQHLTSLDQTSNGGDMRAVHPASQYAPRDHASCAATIQNPQYPDYVVDPRYMNRRLWVDSRLTGRLAECIAGCTTRLRPSGAC
ncbi:hypothetical protein M3J09_005914 [Ascochyta lentis]